MASKKFIIIRATKENMYNNIYFEKMTRSSPTELNRNETENSEIPLKCGSCNKVICDRKFCFKKFLNNINLTYHPCMAPYKSCVDMAAISDCDICLDIRNTLAVARIAPWRSLSSMKIFEKFKQK
jgi:hypothetical protein